MIDRTVAPFPLERYLAALRDRTAWAPDVPIEAFSGPVVPRPVLHRMAYLWTAGLLDDRFETLLLPVLVTASPLLDHLDSESHAHRWGLSREFFRERLESGACILFIDGAYAEAADWPRNLRFHADPQSQSETAARDCPDFWPPLSQ